MFEAVVERENTKKKKKNKAKQKSLTSIAILLWK